jgi:hypothetical protein
MVLFKLIKMEAQLWASLYAWVRRRPYGPDDFPYHARSPMALWMGVVVLTTPIEIAVLELLIPWPWLKITTLVLALYALLWLIMLFASLRSMPHRLEPRGLRLRYGVLTDVFIPYDLISEAQVAMAKAPKVGDGLQLDGESAFLAINGEANLVLRLKEPLSLDRALGKTPPVREVHFCTDEPKRMIERLVSRLKPVDEPVSLSAQT